jgi:Aldehyde dehydrogenase family
LSKRLVAKVIGGFQTALRRRQATTAHVVPGSLVNLAPAERMDVLIADAVTKGAKDVAGGKRNGAVVEATLLDGVKVEMKIRYYGAKARLKAIQSTSSHRAGRASPTISTPLPSWFLRRRFGRE